MGPRSQTNNIYQSWPVPSSCKQECTEKVTDEMVQANFDKYYSFVSEDLKRSFLDKLMRPVAARRPRKPTVNPQGRTNYKYLIFNRQEEVKVCRVAWHHIFAITRHTSSHIVKTRKETAAGTPKTDARGRGK